MYLDNWMIVALIVAFAFNAVYNRRKGYMLGGVTCLEGLLQQKLIWIEDDGRIVKYDEKRLGK